MQIEHAICPESRVRGFVPPRLSVRDHHGQSRDKHQTNYHTVELALTDALIEVRHRIANGVKNV